jgi:hypothetical protein
MTEKKSPMPEPKAAWGRTKPTRPKAHPRARDRQRPHPQSGENPKPRRQAPYNQRIKQDKIQRRTSAGKQPRQTTRWWKFIQRIRTPRKRKTTGHYRLAKNAASNGGAERKPQKRIDCARRAPRKEEHLTHHKTAPKRRRPRKVEAKPEHL